MNETITLERVTSMALRLKPVEQVKLVEKLMLALEETLEDQETPQESLAAWRGIYEGLSQDEVRTIENIVRDRSTFMEQDD